MEIEGYAVINLATGIVENIIVWDGDTTNWSPPDGCIAVVAGIAGIGWSYANGVFTAPPVAPPTPAEVFASQSAILQQLTQLASEQKTALTNRISTLNDAIDLDMAEPEEVAELPVRTAQLKAWKTYAVLLGRVTTQAGWYASVIWPIQPAAGMDLSVSAKAPETV